MGIGAYRHFVTLEHPAVVLDPDTWYCQIQSAATQVVDGQTAYFVRGRYHPGLTLETQLHFEGRTFQVQSVTDLDERHVDVQLLCVEVVARGRAPVGPPVTGPPVITVQPVGETIASGDSVTLTVVAIGTPPVTYQWTEDGVDIDGATNQFYVTGPLTETTSYAVEVTNEYGTVTSSPVTVTVGTPATITTQPVGSTIASGESATLTVVAAGTPPIAYQWTEAGVEIPGATSASYITGPLTETSVYAVTVSNLYGAETSGDVTVTVEAAMLTYQQQIVADGAVAYWPLDDPSGTTARDLAGTRHGAISGGVTLAQPGVTAGSVAMEFDGATGMITVPILPPRHLPGTYEAWITTQVSGSERTFFGSEVWAAGGGFAFGFYPNGHLRIATPDAGNFEGVVVIAPNTWYHAVWTNDGTSLRFYVNGVLDTTHVGSLAVDNTTIANRIGVLDGFTGQTWDGKLQDVAIYQRALTPAEITAHYTKRLAG